MSPEAPRPEQEDAEQQDQIGVRVEMQEKLMEMGDLLDRLPDAPDKRLLRRVLGAALHILIPTGGSTMPWAYKSRLLRTELETALSELRRLVDDGV